MNHLSRFLVISAALAVAAAAQAVTLAGTTKGYFNAGVAANTATLGGLTFTTGTFSAVTDPTTGFYSVGSSIANNFGEFDLNGTSFNYLGNTFTLEITFTLPNNVNPNQPLYTASLLGQVTQGAGGVAILFNTTPQNFTFDGGSFSLIVLPTAVGVNQIDVPITGFGAAVVPGPSALAAFGIGAVANLRRRRRSA